MRMRVSSTVFLVFALALLALAPADRALAQVAVDENRLKAELEAALTRLFPIDPDGMRPVWRGEMEIERAGDFHTVTLPDLSLEFPGSLVFQVGKARMNLRPIDATRQQFNLILPERMPFIDREGREIGGLSIGGQQLGGVWIPRFLQAVRIEGAWTNLLLDLPGRLTEDGNSVRLGIGRLSWQRTLTPDGGENVWSGDERLTADELFVQQADRSGDMRVASLTAENRLVRFNLANAAAFTEITQTLATVQASRAARGGNAPQDKADPQALSALERLEALEPIIGDVASEVTLTGVAISDAENRTLMLDRVTYFIDAKGFDDVMSSIELGVRQQGGSQVPPPGPPDLVPDQAALRLSISRIPNRALWKVIRTGLANAELLSPRIAGSQSTAMLPDVFTSSGMQIELRTGQWRSADLNADLSGAAVFDPEAVHKVILGVELMIDGIDALGSAIPGDSPAQGLAVPVIAMLRGLGQVTMDERGRELLRLRFEIDGEGEFRLNGQDVGDMLGPMLGGPPAE